jgi:hypothetical protein
METGPDGFLKDFNTILLLIQAIDTPGRRI